MYCPVFLWRIYKFIAHLFTGKSELERICNDRDIKSLERSQLVESSIDNSIQLKKIKVEIKSEFDPADVAIKIVEIKRFNQELLSFDSLILPNLISSLEPLSLFQTLKKTIDNRKRIAYDNQNEQHEQLLESLWESLLPDVRRSARLSKEWGTLGFQGMDPATDFRGMGMLGLDNLVYLSIHYPKEAQEILRNSTTKCVYPFAITGINLTSLILNLIEKPHFKDYFYRNSSTINQFNELYSIVFISFDKFYQNKNPKTIMEFNTIKKEFETKISNNINSSENLVTILNNCC